MSNYFPFFTNTNQSKPITIQKNEAQKPRCPFCDYNKLAKNQEVLKAFDESLLVANLYPTIGNTLQTVFIETPNCDANFLTYNHETACLVMRNFFDSYKFLVEKYPDKQIIGIKNAGEFSSGSIHHQHMQLVALDHSLQPTNPQNFEGASVFNEGSVRVNFSDKPATEFYEINLSIANEELFTYGEAFETFCLLLQGSIDFALSTITKTNSYNLAFYFEADKLIVKILPRIVNKSITYTPFFLAFDMHFVPDNLDDYRHQLSEALKKIQS